MTPIEQGLLYGVTILILVSTLVLFVWQLVRSNRRDKP